tara:strand:+ start:22 stop:276 length:255 start_codon:yes stop_codon:yes gene_type:complete
MKNYYLDKSISIKGDLSISGSIIIIKSEETFNNYKDLIKFSTLTHLDNEISVIIIDGDLIIPEWKNYYFNINGNIISLNTQIFE